MVSLVYDSYMKAPRIETERYILRSFKEEDAHLWQVWDVDPEVQAHMPEPVNMPQDIERQYAYKTECESDPEGYYWSIEKKEGETIGTVALTDVNAHHKITDLGIVIGDKTYWGKGVATEVVSVLTRYAFQNLGIQRVSAEVEEGNIPMQKVFEAVGFLRDGEFKSARVKNGARITVLHYGITVS